MVRELKNLAGKPVIEWKRPVIDTELRDKVFGYRDAVKDVIYTEGKFERAPPR